MDKVKAQANVLAQKGQEAAKEGKARLDQAQANRQADAMLRNLGALIYAERTNRGAPDTEEMVSKLVGQISEHESHNGINLAPHSAQAPSGGVPPQGSPADAESTPPQGSPIEPPSSPGDTSPPPQA
jgi:hypothetical protein